MTIRGVIFDMDGLLLDSEVYWEHARREFSASLGCVWGPEDERSVKGHNSEEWAGAIRRRCGLTLPTGEIIDGVTDRMRTLYQERVPLLPGAGTTVQALASVYPLAIASSSPLGLIEFAMRLAGLRDSFAAIVSSDEVGRGKPDPAVFLEAAHRLSLPPAQIAVFEDSTSGILAADRAGMAVIAVPNPQHPPESAALERAALVLGSLAGFTPELLADHPAASKAPASGPPASHEKDRQETD